VLVHIESETTVTATTTFQLKEKKCRYNSVTIAIEFLSKWHLHLGRE